MSYHKAFKLHDSTLEPPTSCHERSFVVNLANQITIFRILLIPVFIGLVIYMVAALDRPFLGPGGIGPDYLVRANQQIREP